MRLDYFYLGVETEPISFYRVPKALIKNEQFKGLSNDAKLLYGLMLDRLTLSMKNDWFDEENRAYIYYKVEHIMEDLNCAKATCTKIMAELDSKKGIGLIERKRQGQGKPDIIYVKNFVLENEEEAAEIQEESKEDFVDHFSEVQKEEVHKFNNCSYKGTENEFVEVSKIGRNYNNINYNNYSKNNLINLSSEQDDEMDRIAYAEVIKQNIAYDDLIQSTEEIEIVDGIYNIICDLVSVPRNTVRIGKIDYPYNIVKNRFMKLNYWHVSYVIDCVKGCKKQIGNINAYLVTALYNAVNTMGMYYSQRVECDLYGDNANYSDASCGTEEPIEELENNGFNTFSHGTYGGHSIADLEKRLLKRKFG